MLTSFLFFISLVLIIYIYGGYHFLIHYLSRKYPNNYSNPDIQEWPNISILLAMKNEEANAKRRVENLLSQYPNDNLEIIIVLDAPTDNTATILTEIKTSTISIIRKQTPVGKSACIGEAIQHAKHDYLVFADARQTFNKGAVKSLIRNLSNQKIGAVSGELVMIDSSTQQSISSSYWSMEKWLRKSESQFRSVIGCTGAIYAIKKEFCPEIIPSDTILDDVFIPMSILLKNKRVVFDSNAMAFDSLIPTPGFELRRKVRTLAGNYQLLFRYPDWIKPSFNDTWWMLVSHKYLRLLGPYLLLCLLSTTFMLSSHWFMKAFLLLQCFGFLLGILGLIFNKVLIRLSVFSSFLLLNLASLLSIVYYLGGSYRKGWSK